MELPKSYVLNEFPYLIAFLYSLIFDESSPPSIRRWALCFTQYQLLRMVTLPLVSHYLHGNNETFPSSREINNAIAGIRSPFFSDWITLAHTVKNNMPLPEIKVVFPEYLHALKSLKTPEERRIGLRFKKIVAV